MSLSAQSTADDAIEVPASREQRLAQYNGFKQVLKGIEEIQLNDNSADMDETQMLIAQANKELERLAQSLNAQQNDISPTANLLKVLLPKSAHNEPSQLSTQISALSHSDELGSKNNACLQQNSSSSITIHHNNNTSSSKIGESASNADRIDKDYSVVILYPPASDPRRNAPYEVLFDNRDWYSCVITQIIPPSSRTERIQYKAWILGYNVQEVVCYEELRRWVPNRITSVINSGTVCHVIHPHSGKFVPAVVERLTLDSTAMVRLQEGPLQNSASKQVQQHQQTSQKNGISSSTSNVRTSTQDTGDTSPSAQMASMLQVPLSHVRVGKIYERLIKRPKLTEDERAARRVQNMKRRREKVETRKQLRADQVAQDAND